MQGLGAEVAFIALPFHHSTVVFFLKRDLSFNLNHTDILSVMHTLSRVTRRY